MTSRKRERESEQERERERQEEGMGGSQRGDMTSKSDSENCRRRKQKSLRQRDLTSDSLQPLFHSRSLGPVISQHAMIARTIQLCQTTDLLKHKLCQKRITSKKNH